jgi:serpin B
MRSAWTFAAVIAISGSGALAGSEAPPDLEPAAVSRLARSSNALGFDLYQRLRGEPGNLVMSPASITTALAMPWDGARGETAAQMQRVLHLEGTADEVLATAGRLSRSLQDPSRPVVFRIANQLFAEKTYQLLPAYLARTQKAFGAPVERLDFQKAPEPARQRINRWVEGKTERRIQDLIPPGEVKRDTRLVLVNAIYFLGDWEVPFDRQKTRPAPFHRTASETTDVPTMYRIGGFSIARKDGVTALEVPYKGGELSMTFLIPDEIEGLAALERGLDTNRLAALDSAMQGETVALALPKFEVRPAASLSLGEDLKALGMPLAFDRDRADFSGIANPANPADRLVLAKVFHKGFVRVDEKGTEAAAATAVLAEVAGAAPGAGPRQVRIDRPFLFLIRDRASGMVLFLGRVSDPSRR